MICKNCGKEIPDSSNFCKYCGSKVEATSQTEGANQVEIGASQPAQNSTITVVFQRNKRMMGCAIPMKVIIDGNHVATLKNGTSQEVQVTPGQHKVILDTIGEVNEQVLTFSPEFSKVYIELIMKMGLVTGKAHIASIRNEK